METREVSANMHFIRIQTERVPLVAEELIPCNVVEQDGAEQAVSACVSTHGFGERLAARINEDV